MLLAETNGASYITHGDELLTILMRSAAWQLQVRVCVRSSEDCGGRRPVMRQHCTDPRARAKDWSFTLRASVRRT